jgi:site-specific DNA recombinase
MSWNKFHHKTRNPRDEWMPIPVPAIISQELFDIVQEKARRNKIESRRNRKNEYLFLAGRLRCGRCGQGMSGYSSHGKTRYRCLSVVNHGATGEPYCKGGVNADDIEPQVWAAVSAVLHDPIKIARELEHQRQQAGDVTRDMDRERGALAKALTVLDREDHQWQRAYATADITLEEFRAYRLDIRQRRERLEQQLQDLA